MEIAITSIAQLLTIIGILAFLVSLITQVFKGVSFLSNIPTDILVFVLSIGLTVVVFIAYMQYIRQAILWYMILATIIAGVIVALVAMYGWGKCSGVWKRFNKEEERGRVLCIPIQ